MPIQDTPFDVAFPILGGLINLCRMGKTDMDFQEHHDQEQQKIMETNQEVAEVENQRIHQDKADPFLTLGLGMSSYRSFLGSMPKVFIGLSFLVAPIIYMYGQNNMIAIKGYAKYSIANLGFDSIRCDSSPFSLGVMLLSCPYGQITKIVPNGIGINAYTNKIRDACLINQ